MQKITPFLWFDTQAEEAAKFYVKALMPMQKLDLKTLRKAAAGVK